MCLITIMRLCYILFILVSIRSQITLITLQTANQSYIMYQNNQVQQQFNDNSKKFNCALPNIYIYEQTPTQLQANLAYTMTIQGTGTYSISHTTRFDNFRPYLSASSCTGNCVVTIINNCPNPLKNNDYFDEININVGNLPPISYRIDCNNQFFPVVFQWGLFILAIMMTILIFASTFLQKSVSYDGFGIALGYEILLFFSLLILFGGVFGAFFIKITNTIMEVICWILGIICTGICCNQVMFLFSIRILNKPLFNIKNHIFKFIRPIQIISLFLGLLFTAAWWFADKNWILNDFLFCCIVISAVQLFKFISLRMATFYFLAILTAQVLVALVVLFFIGQSYNTLILNNFNIPMQMQFPSITKAIDIKCSWLPITEVIFPAIFISYLRRFDNTRQTHVYIIVSSLTFFLGCTVWILIIAFSSFSIPLGLFIEPILLITVVLFAYKRNQIKVIWFGKFYDEDFKDRQIAKKGLRQTIISKDSNLQSVQLQGSILKGCRVDDFSEYDQTERSNLSKISKMYAYKTQN